MDAVASRAMWVWLDEAAPPSAAQLAAFAVRERVTDAFVSVPFGGPTITTRRCAAALRVLGIRVSALGGDPAWVDGSAAVEWMLRCTATGLFDGIDLDIEPWARRDWAGRERSLLAGLARTVRAVGARSTRPVELDVPPWIAELYPAEFVDCVRGAAAVTLMAYRDRAPAVLSASARARRLIAVTHRPFRIGVDTRPSADASTTFADDGRAVLERELALVTARLGADPFFAGVAVHDYDGWRALGR